MDAPKSDRSDSVSSAASSTSPISPTRTGRRASGPLFASLQEHKRPNDAASIARRQSLNEQRPPPGIFGTMWNK
ncbi:Conidiation-specific protein 8 [Cytospora mali]|uniref:Conidiation-specific protein 8 n=1 Tax=Cytospora mali TaxID=578113 RepID=A0A194VPY8_CYTMA|nr:Conidiation-specific protein 8 [Valsa mali]